MSPSKDAPIELAEASIIAVDKFILATRDSGYRGTGSAISELVDNAIQAKAKRISIRVYAAPEGDDGLEVSILDNGVGMDPFTLRQALRFGGSSRFGDRRGLGRYGMGLPNSSLSQGRRLTVYSWQRAGEVYSTQLDVDQIASGEVTEVPAPRRADLPLGGCPSKSGTLVVWGRCDRLDNRRISTLERKLASALGQTFRYYLWGDTTISINDAKVEGVDPLFLRRKDGEPVAETFGEPMDYEIRASPSDPRTGQVKVTFTELPVHVWHGLSNERKRELGISKGAGVSVVRAGREVDYGWFFMGNKRRENYDDWFRCQVEFDPILDEAFGITHTKQQVRPQQYVLDILTPDIEATAHALNARARKAYAKIQAEVRVEDAERVAAACDSRLSPIGLGRPPRGHLELVGALKRRHPSLRDGGAKGDRGPRYRIVEDEIAKTEFFTYAFVDGTFVLVLNPAHQFYRKIYRPLLESDLPKDKALRAHLELVLLSAARAEAALKGKVGAKELARFRKEWSDTIATFLDK